MPQPTTIATAPGHTGDLVLRRAGAHHEIIANGMFLMDTRAGTSERLLVTAALDHTPGPLLIGGLGVGFSLAAALEDGRTTSVTVVEREEAVIDWNRRYLGNAPLLDDPRVTCVAADLRTWLAGTEDRFGALCLDIDNGPDWTLDSGNASLYSLEGLSLLRSRLTAGGVLAVWSAAASPAFVARLESSFGSVRVVEVPVPRGEPDVVFLATA